MMRLGEPSYLLVVDDNAMNRDMLSRRLEREGYRVGVAEEGYQALGLLRAEHFDLILLDVTMPGLNGFEVLEIIRREKSLADLPVIMATARDADDDIITGFKMGANDYVTKPINFPVLLARVQTQLQLRNLTQLKDRFLQIASHDLKNPLHNILMSAHLAAQAVEPGDSLYEMLGIVERQSKTMQRIVSDFLDFQALQDGRLQLDLRPTSLNQVTHSVIEENAEYARSKSIAVQVELEEQLPDVKADEDRIAQVIQNFLSNAIKFCPENTVVIVRTRSEGDCAILEVSDSGPGLTEADLSKVFMKYARLSNKPTGGEKSSGLGLSICKHMVELHGGDIGVYNNPDCGATFWFSLSLAEQG